MIENNLESFKENLVSVKDFEREPDLIVGNKLERFGYLKSAKDHRVSFVFYLHEEKDNRYDNWVKFISYVFINEKDEMEIEINKKFYRRFQKPHVWGVFILNNVKIVFESEVSDKITEDKEIYILKLLSPKRMIRYQRREAYRVPIPSFSNLSIDLEDNSERKDLISLPIVNLSVGGAAILLNTNENIENLPQYFENATLNLGNQVFNGIKMKVCRIRKVNSVAVPLNLAAKKMD